MSSPQPIALLVLLSVGLLCLLAAPAASATPAYSLSLFVPQYSAVSTWSNTASPSVTVPLPPFLQVNVTALSSSGVQRVEGTCGSLELDASSSTYVPSGPNAQYATEQHDNYNCSFSYAVLDDDESAPISLTLVWVGPIVVQPVAVSEASQDFISIDAMATATDCSTLLVVASTTTFGSGSIYEMSSALAFGRTYGDGFSDVAGDATSVYGLKESSGYVVQRYSRATGLPTGTAVAPNGAGYAASVALDLHGVLFVLVNEVAGDADSRVDRFDAASLSFLGSVSVTAVPGAGTRFSMRYSSASRSMVLAQQVPAVLFLLSVDTLEVSYVQTTNPSNLLTIVHAVDDAGLAYLEDANFEQLVVVNTSSGVELTSFRMQASYPFGQYEAAALDCSGNLFVANQTQVLKQAAFVAAPTSTAPSSGSVLGDPQFVGLRGQSYQVHGIDGAVYNLISDAQVSVNARFSFLSHGECRHDAAGRPLFTCWSHPGSYLSSVAVRTSAGDTLVVVAGKADSGFALVTLNNRSLAISSSNSAGAGGLSVEYDSLRTLTIRHAGLYALRLENSDGFVNILRLSVSDWSRLVQQVQSHGLIGQTWRSEADGAQRRGEEVAAVEGRVDDYVLQGGDLLGTDFVYNQFEL